ncbi:MULTISPECIES: NADPH-dependent F420 reductase [unclassified Actinotalea]|uniref:NADPH-dependent F420 reductase n=1 Tax=unclassified Actinotalea TaxID=2638618 RepID=UPI0015F3D6F3|nr:MULTISPECIES: NAD(P)-binding domain-containing protein [unclassified Actinotalea]
MTTIGLIGSGHIGSQLARLAVARGHEVVVSNSRGPETLVDLVTELGDLARAGTPQEAAQGGDVVVVTIPVHAIGAVPVEPLAGKVVVDTNNYYPQRDGNVPELDAATLTSSELLQRHLPTSRVVKAFNHIPAADLTAQGQEAGTPDRRALVVAADDADARATVAALVDSFGFDVVEIDSLAGTWRIEPGTPGYGPRRTADELRADLAAAQRPTS